MKKWKPTPMQLIVMKVTCPHLVGGKERNCTQLYGMVDGRDGVVFYYARWRGFMRTLWQHGVFLMRYKGNQTLWRLGPVYDQLVEEGVL